MGAPVANPYRTAASRTLAYRDFVPGIETYGGLLTPDVYHSFKHIAEAAAVWIHDHQIDVVSVETVTLRGSQDEESASEAARGERPPGTFQIVRVWYWQRPSPSSDRGEVDARRLPRVPR